MPFYAETMIAYQILLEVNEHPEKYNIETQSGRTHLYMTTMKLAQKKVKSLRGAFDQATIIGFCLASNWNKKNKAFLNKDEQQSLQEFMILNKFITNHKNDFSKKSIPSSLEEALIKGFQNGYKLGINYAIGKDNRRLPLTIIPHFLRQNKFIFTKKALLSHEIG